MALLFVILLTVLLFKFTFFLLRLCGRFIGGMFSIFGFILLGILAIFGFGLSFIFIPVLIVVGIISICRAITKTA